MAGVGPFSEAVLCQTPCSVPAAVSSIRVLKESELQRYETPLDADEDEEDEDSSPRPAPIYSPSTCLGISWEPPCDHGSEITSYLIDLGERQPIVVGPVTKHIIQHLQPDTSYRLVFCHVTGSSQRQGAPSERSVVGRNVHSFYLGSDPKFSSNSKSKMSATDSSFTCKQTLTMNTDKQLLLGVSAAGRLRIRWFGSYMSDWLIAQTVHPPTAPSPVHSSCMVDCIQTDWFLDRQVSIKVAVSVSHW